MKKTLFLSAILGAALCSSAFGAVTNIDMLSWNALDGATLTAEVGSGVTETWDASQDWNTQWSIIFSVDTSTITSGENLTLAGILLKNGSNTSGYAEGAKMAGNTTAQLTSWSAANKESSIDLTGVSNVTFVISHDSSNNYIVAAYNSSDFSTALVSLSQSGQKFTGYSMAGATFGGTAGSKYPDGNNKVTFADNVSVGSYTITKAGYTLGSVVSQTELTTYAAAQRTDIRSWKGGDGDAAVWTNECSNWLQDGATNATTDTLHFGKTATSKTVTVDSTVNAAKVYIGDDFTFHMGAAGKIVAPISVNEGKVLTIDNTGASTTWDLAVTGKGTMKYTGSTQMLYTGDLASTATLEGVMTNGTSNIKYNRNFAAGTGTLKNVTIEGIDAGAGNASITLDGVRGYFAQNGNVRNINLVGNGLTLTNGWSGQGFTIENLTGSGQLARDASAYATSQVYTINNAANWTGTYKNGTSTTTLTVNSSMGNGSAFENNGTLTLNLNNGTSYGTITGYANSTGTVKITNSGANVTVNQIIQDGNQNTSGRINVEFNTSGHKTTISNWTTINNATLMSNSSVQFKNLKIAKLTVEAGNSSLFSDAGIGSNDTHRLQALVLNDGAHLTFGTAHTTVPTITLGADSTITVGDGDNHNFSLTVTTLTVDGNAGINANLVVSDNGTMDFSNHTELTMGCTVTIGDNVTIKIDDSELASIVNTGSVMTIINDVEGVDMDNLALTLGSGWKFVDAQGNSLDAYNLRLDVVNAGDGKVNIVVAPEPATATLSLLALAGLAARRRRH